MNLYKPLIRPLLFKLDPETAHRAVLAFGPAMRWWPISTAVRTAYHFEDPRLRVQCFGLDFSSPICFAAGMDKNADAVELLSSFGCAALEVGVVSAKPQSGNERPRVHRFPEARAIVNRMGNPNIGADAAEHNLKRVRAQRWLPWIGLNIGKTTATPIEEALADYRYTFQKLYDLCDYFVLNVSCPNVAEYSKLQEKERLAELFAGLQAVNIQRKPLVVKLAPDLTETQVDDALEAALAHDMSAVIATNTTTSRADLPAAKDLPGGLSGAPLFHRSLGMVKYVAARLQGKMPIIGVGGIFSADDVIAMMRAGATLVELYTALVYEGPGLVKRLKMNLVRQMERDGLPSISAYIGAGDKR